VKKVETPKPTHSMIVHKSAPDTTTASAGAAKCSLQNVRQIGAFAKDGGIAIGFGQQSGLVAWSSPEGLRIKPLSSAGVAAGSALPTSFPKGTKPAAIIAVGQGFAVIAERTEMASGPCESTCGDKPCPEAKPGETPAQTCQKPIGHDYFVVQTDLEGKNSNAGRPFHTGLVDIETILPGDGRASGILTKNEVIWIQTRPDGRLDSERVELPSGAYVIPVRGSGPPAILILDKDGSMRLLDERGTHDIEGKFAGMQGKATAAPPAKKAAAPTGKSPAAPAPAAPAPAKPTVEMNFRSYWSAKGEIAIGHRLGDATQYAVIEKLVLRMLSETESQSVRETFAASLDIRIESGRLQRIGWDKRPIGSDIDVHEADPASDTSRLRYAWSGSAFVFALPSNPPHQTEAQAVGIVSAKCANEKP
jgi:hypothetical protein